MTSNEQPTPAPPEPAPRERRRLVPERVVPAAAAAAVQVEEDPRLGTALAAVSGTFQAYKDVWCASTVAAAEALAATGTFTHVNRLPLYRGAPTRWPAAAAVDPRDPGGEELGVELGKEDVNDWHEVNTHNRYASVPPPRRSKMLHFHPLPPTSTHLHPLAPTSTRSKMQDNCIATGQVFQSARCLGDHLRELRDGVTYEDLVLQTTKGLTLDCPAKNSWLVVDEEHQAQLNMDWQAATKLRGPPPAFMHARNMVLAACADSRHPQSLVLADRARDACKRLQKDPTCQKAEADLRTCVAEARTLPRAEESSDDGDDDDDEEPRYASTDEDDVLVHVQDGGDDDEAARKARRREQNKLAQKKYAQSAAGKATAKARSDSQKAERAAARRVLTGSHDGLEL